MLRFRIVTCDICKQDITYANTRYKFRMRCSSYPTGWEYERLDMCDDCMDAFLERKEEKKKHKHEIQNS